MSLQALEKRTKQIEDLAQTIKKQFDLLKTAVGSPTGASSKGSVSSTQGGEIPQGSYVVFISTHADSIPYDVIAAYLMASRLLKRQGSKISLKIVDKQIHKSASLLTPNRESIEGNWNITRLLFRLAGKEPCSVVESTQLDEWTQYLSDGLNFHKKENFHNFIQKLESHFVDRSYLVGYFVSSIDLSLYQQLLYCSDWQKMKETIQFNHGAFNTLRYYNTLNGSSLVSDAIDYVKHAIHQATVQVESSNNNNNNNSNKNKQDDSVTTNNKNNTHNKPKVKGGSNNKGGGKSGGGKGGGSNKGGSNKGGKDNSGIKQTGSWDIGISSEWQGKIVTRFPPEPSGYLHIGHAKAAFLNREIADRYNGKMLVRLDDTNPSKEKGEFVASILRDLDSLGIKPDCKITHTSDYFDLYIEYCEIGIKNGYIFADKTAKDQMQKERKERIPSEYRNQSIDENLRLWKEMIDGSDEGLKTCMRIKLDMNSDNGTLRDPVVFRCNTTDPHPQTGMKYKVYPTYDFACPIVDSVEGVTHALRSKEYNERDVQYSMIWDLVCKDKVYNNKALTKPNIFQFSRMDLVRTELSKRKLQGIIDSGKAHGWDDPRLPTVQGILRRGLTVQALKEFVYESAASKRNNMQEWDKIWTFNKKVLDPIVHRYFAIEKADLERKEWRLLLTNCESNTVYMRPLLPKEPNGLQKCLHVSNNILIEHFDGELIKSQTPKKIVLMNLGIVNIESIDTYKQNIIGNLDLNDKDFKKKQICTWVTGEKPDCVPLILVEIDYLFTSDGEVNQENTWFETHAYGEPAMRRVKKGEIIQLLKRGFYICDKPYLGRPNEPGVFIFVPDGRSKSMSKLASATNKVQAATR